MPSTTFEDALALSAPEITAGFQSQARVGCCKISQISGGVAWSDPNNAQFHNNGKYAKVIPVLTLTGPGTPCYAQFGGGVRWQFGSKWIVFQDFKFSIPQNAILKGPRIAFRGHQIFDPAVVSAVEVYNFALASGDVLYPAVTDRNPTCFGTYPNDPAFGQVGLGWDFVDVDGLGTDNVEKAWNDVPNYAGVYNVPAVNLWKVWTPSEINDKSFGAAVRLFNPNTIGSPQVFLDSVGIGWYYALP